MSNEKGILSKVLKIGLPVALENMVHSLVNFIDVFMVGTENVMLGLGVSAVTALGFSNQIFFIFIISMFGMNSGGGILSAQYYGIKDYKNLKKCLGVTIVVGMIFSTLFLIAGELFPQVMIGMFTKDLDVINLSVKYFRIAVLTYPLVAISFAISMQLRVIGMAKYSLYSSIIGLFINMIGNYILIFGNFGFPGLGVVGAAISTVFARLISTIYLILIIKKFKLPISGKIREIIDVPWDFYIKVLKISLPVFGHEIAWVTGASIYVGIFGRMGTDSAASIQIVKAMSSLILTLIIGLTSATSVIVGNEIGASNFDKAYKYSVLLLKVSAGIGIFLGFSVYVGSPLLLKVMNVSPRLYPIVKSVIVTEAILIIIKSLTLQLIVGILRSGGDTFWTLIVDLIPLWFVAIPITYYAGLHLGLHVAVVYLLSGIDEMLKFYPCVKRLKSRKWMNNLVVE